MPNVIQYSTIKRDNSLSKGDMRISIGTDAGPTSTTEFYNGINPPNGGYTIYHNKYSGGPSILCPTNDAELIVMTNQMAETSYTTINQCFSYFAGQDDKMVMFNPINPMVSANDNLKLYLNASPLPAYPRSGNTCFDLSEQDNNAAFYNGATFESNLETMEFDGVNDYILTNNNATITGDQSIETTIKFDSLEGFLQGLVSNHDYSNTSNFGINQVRSNKIGISIGYTNGTREYQDKYSTTSVATGRFYHIVMTFNLSANQCKLYIDGELDSTFNLTKTVKYTSRPMVLGRWDYQYTNYYFDGEISQVKYYDKTLSAEEVLINYNQSPIITDGLVFAIDAGNLASYENGSTTAYSLTGSDSGTLTNGVEFNKGNGGVWNFSGVDDYLSTDYGNGLNPTTQDLSYELWVLDNGAVNTGLFLVQGNWGSSNRFYVGLNGGNLAWGIQERGWASNNTSFNPNNGEWFHVTITFSGNTALLYANGVLQATDSITSYTFNQNLSLGSGLPFNSGYNWNGYIASCRVYEKTLTAEEITQNYKANINKFN